MVEGISLNKIPVEARYPGPFEPVTEKEFNDALLIAEYVILRAETLLSEK